MRGLVFAIVLSGLVLARSAEGESAPLTAKKVWSGPEVTSLGAPSPDGEWLSIVDRATGDLAVRHTASGKVRRLTRNQPGSGEFAYFSIFSRDGGSIAYAWHNQDKFYDLRILPAKGGEPRILYSNPEAGFVQPCAFTPDGSEILTLFFRKDNISQIAFVNVATGSVRVLRSLEWVYPKRMDLSPDGRFIVYDSFSPGTDNRDLYLLKTDGSSESALLPGPAMDLFPLFSPNGVAILFASDRGGEMGLWRLNLEDGQAAGDPLSIAADVGRVLLLGITAKGDLFYSVRTGEQNVFVAPAAPGSKAHRLSMPGFGRNSSPAWSPLGDRIAVLSRRGTENYGEESKTIQLYSLKGQPPRDLSPRLAHMERIRWTPDGTALTVSGSDGKGRSGLFRVEIEDSRTTPLVTSSQESYRGIEGFEDRGNGVVFVQGSKILRLHPETRDRQVLYRHAAPIDRIVQMPEGWVGFSSGRKIGFVSHGEHQEVATLPGDGPLTSLVSHGPTLFAAVPGQIWKVQIAGPVTAIDIGIEHEGELTIDPAGEVLAVHQGRREDSIWIMEGAAAR